VAAAAVTSVVRQSALSKKKIVIAKTYPAAKASFASVTLWLMVFPVACSPSRTENSAWTTVNAQVVDAKTIFVATSNAKPKENGVTKKSHAVAD